MRKKSHISLSRYLVAQLQNEELSKHKKAFYIGSILPDCSPSFFTQKHTYEGTIHIVREEIMELVKQYSVDESIDTKFCRKLGVVTHYIADYFTFPHNQHYTGGLRDHCLYEKTLKYSLKQYVTNKVEARNQATIFHLNSIDQLFVLLEEIHQVYRTERGEINTDLFYIVEVCFEVVEAILQFITQRYNKDATLLQVI